jgi:hypothetical protein
MTRTFELTIEQSVNRSTFVSIYSILAMSKKLVLDLKPSSHKVFRQNFDKVFYSILIAYVETVGQIIFSDCGGIETHAMFLPF